MKGTTKRILSVLLTLSMMLSSFPAGAEEGLTGENSVLQSGNVQTEESVQQEGTTEEKNGEQLSGTEGQQQVNGTEAPADQGEMDHGSSALYGVAVVDTLERKEPELTEQTIDVTLFTDGSMTQLINGPVVQPKNLPKSTKSTLAAPQAAGKKAEDGETTISISGELPEGSYAVGWPVDIGSVVSEKQDDGMIREAEVLGAYQLELYNADGTKIENTETPVTVNLTSKSMSGKLQESGNVEVVPLSRDGRADTSSPMTTRSSGNTLSYTTKVLDGFALLLQWYHVSNHMIISFTAAEGLNWDDWLDAGILIESQRMWYTSAVCPDGQAALEALAMKNRDARIVAHILIKNLPAEGTYSLYNIVDEQGTLSEEAIRENVQSGDVIDAPASVYGYALIGEKREGELSYKSTDGTYQVTVTYDNTTGIHMRGTRLVVEEIDRESEAYEEHYNRASEVLKGMEEGRLFEIRIEDENTGEILQPAEGTYVDVLVELLKNNYRAGTEAHVVHLGENPEVLKVSVTRSGDDYAYAFQTRSFSPFMVSYTVDFYYNGYRFSIIGESEILLSDLMNRLGISNIEATDVKNVLFSDNSLLKTEKAGNDWKLISTAPFDTEEYLTVEITDGSIINIKVTDQQSDSFFEGAKFKVENVLAANNTETMFFSTLGEAITEANSNDNSDANRGVTITFLDNYILINDDCVKIISEKGRLRHPVVINGNGKSLSADSNVSSAWITVQITDTNGKVIIQNLKFDGAGCSSSNPIILNASTYSNQNYYLTIDRCELNRGDLLGCLIEAGKKSVLLSNTIIDGQSKAVNYPLVHAAGAQLKLVNTTIRNHSAAKEGVCAVESTEGTEPVIVSGNTNIIGNTAAGKPANLAVTNADRLTLNAGLTGTVGVTTNQGESQQFAQRANNTIEGFAKLMNDKDPDLVATIIGTTTADKNKIWWTVGDDGPKNFAIGSNQYKTLSGAFNAAPLNAVITGLVSEYVVNETESNTVHAVTIQPGSSGTLVLKRGDAAGDMITSSKDLTLDNITLDGNNKVADGSLLKMTANVVLTLNNVTAQNHTTETAGVCAVDASEATGLSKVKVSGTTTITGNTTVGGASANLKTNGENVLHVSANLTGTVGVTTNKNQAGNQFATKEATVTETGSFICDTNPSLIVRIDNNNLLWDSIDNVANMFGNPNTTIDNLKTYPAADDLAVLPGNAVAGDENEDSDNPFMTWKSASYNNDNNSADITLNFFKKQINIKLDFIFVIDEAGTMTDNKSANGYTTSQAKWARYAAITASKGIFQVNSQYAENGAENRIAIVSYSGHGPTTQIYRSGWMTDTTAALIWASQTKVGGGDTYHDVVVNDILSLANASRTAGHTPVLVWMCDYTARYGKGYSGCVTEAHMNQIKAAIPNRYAMLIYQAYNNTYKARMGYLTDRHFYMLSYSDPSTLVTPIIQIIRDAVAKCGTDLVVNDEFVNGIATGADSNGITSSGAETNAATYDAASNIAQWKLVNDNASDNRLNAATMFTKVINVPMTDDVYSGSMPTNGHLVVKEGDTEVNKIPAADSPLLKKPLTLVNRKTGHTGDFIASTFAVYKKEGETETLLWKGTTDATTGKADIPWAATDEKWTSEDEGGAAAFLPGTNYILKELTPATGTVLPSGDWLISVDSNYMITAAAENHAESEDRILAVGYYSGKMEIYDDIEPMIHFDLNGGTWTHEGGADNAVQFRMNETHHTYTVTSDVPVREGFAFVGWLASVTENDEVNGKTYKAGDEIRFYRHTDNDDVTLTAQWAEALTLTVIKTWTDNTAAAGADQSNGNNSITLTFREEDGDTLIATDFIGITQTDPNVTVGTDGKVTLSKSTEDDGQGGTTQVWPARWTVMVPATAKGVTEHVDGYVDDVKANFSDTAARIGGVNVAAYTIRITNTRAIVKITDASGTLLYKKNGTPAVYTTATALQDAFSDINNDRLYQDSAGTLQAESTDTAPFKVQMLVSSYTQTGGAELARGKYAVLTTAGANDTADGYPGPYTGAASTVSTIIRGNTFTSGSMIKNKGTLTLTNITLDGNKITIPYSGGIVYSDSNSSLTVSDGSTLKNSYIKRKGCNEGGGAIYSIASTMNITNAQFINNFSGSDYVGSAPFDGYFGGAITVSNYAELNITGTTFADNTAINDGGAIYMYNSRPGLEAKITNCTFRNNTATSKGGAVSSDAIMRIERCSFANNSALYGGAIYNRHLPAGMNTTNIINSGLENNTAIRDGGAIYAEAYGNGHTKISNCTITGNKATGNGGAIFKKGHGEIHIISGNFSNNEAANGGAVYFDTDHYREATFTDCNIIDNKASQNGGAVYYSATESNGDLTFTGGKIASNNAGQNGGAVYVKLGSRSTEDIVFNNVTIGGTNAGDGNTAVNGGALYVLNKGTIRINSGSSVIGNKATDDGGGIYLDNGYPNLYIESSAQINRNTADRNGGAIYLNNPGTVNINGTISNNTAGKDGGAVYNNNTKYLQVQGGSVISDNKAAENGGAFFLNDGLLPINGGTISGNTAVGKGGAIYVNKGTAYVTNATISDNTGADGGISGEDGYRINFAQSPTVYDNHAAGNSTEQRNVVITKASNIRVTGIMQATGKIGVYSLSEDCDSEGEQFAICGYEYTNSYFKWNLDAFWNDKTNDAAGNPLRGMYGDGERIIWSIGQVTITKQVTGTMGDTTKDFTFTISVDGLTAEELKAINPDGLTQSATDPCMFKLKGGSNGNRIILYVPYGKQVTLQETNAANYTTTIGTGRNAPTGMTEEGVTGPTEGADSETKTITFTVASYTTPATITVVNNLDAVSPTGISFTYLPYILMLLCGAALMVLSRKKRRIS